jgi:integrase
MTATVNIKKDRPNYFILVRYKDEATGKERQRWITTDIPVKGNNKRKVEERRKEILAEYEEKGERNIDLSRDILFTVFIDEWLNNIKSSIAPTTFKSYEFVINTHIKPFFEPKKLKVKELTSLHIEQYKTVKLNTVSPNTVIKHLRNISGCLENAVEHRLIPFNPCKLVKLPKKIKFTGAKQYNEGQIEQLLECSKNDPLEIVIMLTVFYGLRRSEVLGIKWGAVDFDNKTIAINHTVTLFGNEVFKTNATKNDSSNSVVPMPNIIINRLERWRAQQDEARRLQPNDYIDEGYICTQYDGSLIKPDYVSSHFKLLLEKNGMPHIRFHDLRHSSAGYLKYLKFDLKDIQIWLRHKDIQTTLNLYMNLDMTAKTNIAENLNERFAQFAI